MLAQLQERLAEAAARVGMVSSVVRRLAAVMAVCISLILQEVVWLCAGGCCSSTACHGWLHLYFRVKACCCCLPGTRFCVDIWLVLLALLQQIAAVPAGGAMYVACSGTT
jgi:hypothetical protein